MRKVTVVIPKTITEHTMWVAAAYAATHDVTKIKFEGLDLINERGGVVYTKDVDLRELFLTEGLLFLVGETHPDIKAMINRVHVTYEHDHMTWCKRYNVDSYPYHAMQASNQILIDMFKREPKAIAMELGKELQRRANRQYLIQQLKVWLHGHLQRSVVQEPATDNRRPVTIVACATWPTGCCFTMEERLTTLEELFRSHQIRTRSTDAGSVILIVGEVKTSSLTAPHDSKPVLCNVAYAQYTDGEYQSVTLTVDQLAEITTQLGYLMPKQEGNVVSNEVMRHE